MAFIAVLCVIWVLYCGFTEKKKGDKEALKYEEEQNRLLGLDPWNVRMEKLYSKKNKEN